MLSRPDFAEKQIILIWCEQLKSLSLQNSNLLIKQHDETVNKISSSKIFCIFVAWDCTISSKLIKELLSHQICIYLLTSTLKPLCLIWSSLEGNYLLRRYQYNLTDEDNLHLAKQLITNKIMNQLDLLNMIRNKDDTLQGAIMQMNQLIENIPGCVTTDSLRGMEWNAAKLFFTNYFAEMGWYRRAPRTREDIPNFLLDIWYSYLYGVIDAHLSLYGFDVYKGFFHTQFFERKSLVCDLVEPLRCLIDHAVRTWYNLKKIDPKDFKYVKGEYEIGRDSRIKYSKLFLGAIIKRKNEIFDFVKWYYRMMMTWQRIMPQFTFSAQD